MISDWVQFNAESGNYNVQMERDENISSGVRTERFYIHQIQGTPCLKLMSDGTDG